MSESETRTLRDRLRDWLRPNYVRSIEESDAIGGQMDTVKSVYVEGWDAIQEAEWHFESGVYRLDTSGDKPEFVEVEDDG